MKESLILGIETSCDETAASIVRNGREVLSNIIFSQIDTHKKYGGVVPEIASRKHMDNISYVVDEALKSANTSFTDLSAIAVTNGPGLAGALLIGLSYAKGLSYSTEVPLIGVHHIEGHICANFLNNNAVKPPFVCLIASGGHTHLVLVKDYHDYSILGKTRDDAAGEAFDKVARSLGLTYPGGPAIEACAKDADPYAIDFPRAYLEEGSLDFSFSGLKSAVLNYINKCNMQNIDINKADIAASFQQAVVEVLVEKTMKACKLHNIENVCLAGGVSCNKALRSAIAKASIEKNLCLNVPEPIFCTDNAAMIACCGYYYIEAGKKDLLNLNAYPNLVL